MGPIPDIQGSSEGQKGAGKDLGGHTCDNSWGLRVASLGPSA